MKYVTIFIILFLCIVISTIFTHKNKVNKKLSKENYGDNDPFYTKTELKSILYPIPDCTTQFSRKLFKQTIAVNTENKGIIDEYERNAGPIPIYQWTTYDLTSNENKYRKSIIPPICKQGLCGNCWAYGIQCMLYALINSNYIDLENLIPSVKGIMDCFSDKNNVRGTCPLNKEIPCNGCDGCDTFIVFENIFNKTKFLCSQNERPDINLKCYTDKSSEAGMHINDCSVVKLYDFPGCGNCSIDASIIKADIIIQPLDLIKINIPGTAKQPDLTDDQITLLKKCIYIFGPLNFTYAGAYNDDFNNFRSKKKEVEAIYKGSVLLVDTSVKQKDVLHNMTVVGWKELTTGFFSKTKNQYWKVRNTYGTDFGYQGYMYFPIQKNIFYESLTNGSAVIRAIRESRNCILPKISGETKRNIQTKCIIEILTPVSYSNNLSIVKFRAKCFLGLSLFYSNLYLTIESSVIDTNYPSENFIPINDVNKSYTSRPKFYVNKSNNEVVSLYPNGSEGYSTNRPSGNYYEDEAGKKQTEDYSLINWYILEMNIELDKLLYNSSWNIQLKATGDNGIILNAAQLIINWSLKIKRQKAQVLQAEDSTTGTKALFYIKFEVLLPINEQFKLANTKNNFVDSFPNTNIFPDNGSSVVPNFVPGTGTISIPLIPGNYYYIFDNSRGASAQFYDNNLNVISVTI